mgnify:CR=1 FL=1
MIRSMRSGSMVNLSKPRASGDDPDDLKANDAILK